MKRSPGWERVIRAMRDIPCPRCSAQRNAYCDNTNERRFVHQERVADREALTTKLELLVYRRQAALRKAELQAYRAHLTQLRETP